MIRVLFFLVIQQFLVVSCNFTFEVGHTFVANLDCISVYNFAEWVALRETFVDQFQKFFTNVGFHID